MVGKRCRFTCRYTLWPYSNSLTSTWNIQEMEDLVSDLKLCLSCPVSTIRHVTWWHSGEEIWRCYLTQTLSDDGRAIEKHIWQLEKSLIGVWIRVPWFCHLNFHQREGQNRVLYLKWKAKVVYFQKYQTGLKLRNSTGGWSHRGARAPRTRRSLPAWWWCRGGGGSGAPWRRTARTRPWCCRAPTSWKSSAPSHAGSGTRPATAILSV